VIVKAGLVVIASTFAASVMERVAGTLGLVAASVVAIGIIVGAGVKLWRFARGLEKVVTNTSALPDFMRAQAATNRKVSERLDDGAERMERIERNFEMWASTERSAISGAVAASNASPEPRSRRRTDPAPRTGWRE
jgi:hypothetical protein